MTRDLTGLTRVILGLMLAALLALSVGWGSEAAMTQINATRVAQEARHD